MRFISGKTLRPCLLALALATVVPSLPSSGRAEEDLQSIADEMEASVEQGAAEEDAPAPKKNESGPAPKATEKKQDKKAEEKRPALPTAELPKSAETAAEESAPPPESVRPGIAVCGKMENRRRRAELTCQQAKGQSGKLRGELNKRCQSTREEFNRSFASCPGFKRF